MMKLFTVDKQTQPMQTSRFSLGRESVNADQMRCDAMMKDAETRTNRQTQPALVSSSKLEV